MESSGLTRSLTENLKLVAGTFQSGHGAKVQIPSPLAPGQLHAERVLLRSATVASGSTLTLLKCRTSLPLVAGVEVTRLMNRALGRHLGSELGPVQFPRVRRVTLAVADVEERVTMATAGLEGAEGHRHGDADVHIQDAEICRL